MVVLQMKPARLEPSAKPEEMLASTPVNASLEDEIDIMLAALQVLDPGRPDIILATTMAMMARCTELYVHLVRVESTSRKARLFRTQQLQKIMDLIDFEYKAASRLIEVRRQELDATR